jgi:hypothetical protein
MTMAFDTFIACVGVYRTVEAAEADYDLVKDLHRKVGLIDAYDAAGMSRSDLKELGEHLDEGQAGLVVIAVSDKASKVEREMRRAEKLQAKQLKADTAEIEQDARTAGAE